MDAITTVTNINCTSNRAFGVDDIGLTLILCAMFQG